MTRTIVALAALALAAPAEAQVRTVPYWASIAANEAMMRTGPDRSYPAFWVYKRRDLPLRVVQIQGAWRRVQEQDGTSGWMLASLLSVRRTGVIIGATRPIRATPDESSRLLWQVEPGVVGRLLKCELGWCRIQIGARVGYVLQAGLWGTDAGEWVV